MGYNSVAENTDLHSSVVWLPNLRNFERIRTYSRSRSSKVIDLVVNLKRICDFLLVINSNAGVCPTVFEILTFKLNVENSMGHTSKVTNGLKIQNGLYFFLPPLFDAHARPGSG